MPPESLKSARRAVQLDGGPFQGTMPASTWAAEHRGQLLTLPEVAAYLRVHPKTVRRWIAQDGLPCVRIGNRVRFDATDILRWVSARKEG